MPARKRSPKKPESLVVNFTPDISDTTASYYCNFLQVKHSEYEFIITIFQSPATLKPEQLDLAKKGRPIPLEPLAQIIMPAKVGVGLIDALTAQRLKYESIFGSLKVGKR